MEWLPNSALIPSIEMQRYHSFFTKTKGGVGFICIWAYVQHVFLCTCWRHYCGS